MINIKFNNTYLQLPERFYQRINPEVFAKPQLITFNEDLANELEIDFHRATEEDLTSIFSGQKILEGSEPIAQAYAGLQFGQPVPQLGDGRAHLLGECKGHDIQLKGSGRTCFSRNGDGRSALGPVLREYLVSEAMHHLNVPTTRALCAVTTGEVVNRQFGPEPGGVLTRVAKSHIRVGTFQFFSFQQDLDAIQQLLDYTINRHYPELKDITSYQDKSLELLKALSMKQGELVAKWSALGFIHGVMNTDNFSLAGITIDYGPCAFMDEFRFHKVFSSIDSNKRYSYFNQVPIAQWNIARLADCLLPLIHEEQDRAISLVEKEILPIFDTFPTMRMEKLAEKLGIADYAPADETLITAFLTYLERESLDFTLAFRNLPKLYKGESDYYPKGEELNSFLKEWKGRVGDVSHLDQLNPLVIPRNHQVEKAIAKAYQGDFEHFHKMLLAIRTPFSCQSNHKEFAKAPSKEERVFQTFCGT